MTRQKKTVISPGDVSLPRQNFNCYVINLEKNTERLEHINTMYDASDLKDQPLIRVDAVKGRDIDVLSFLTPRAYTSLLAIEQTGQRFYHADLTRGAVGCYLSHLKVYDMIMASDKEYGIVFEDDVHIDPDVYASHIKNSIDIIPGNWDIILLGCLPKDVITHDTCRKMLYFWGTWAYIINRKGIMCMQKYANVPISYQIDTSMSKLAKEGLLHIYAPHHDVVMPMHFGTEIQTSLTYEFGKNPYDFVDDEK